MLKLIDVANCQSKVALFSSYDPQKTTWVVSDLRSKFDLQTQLIHKQGYYEDHTVLRASELWRALLKRLRPEFRVVSRDFALLFIKKQLAVLKLDEGVGEKNNEDKESVTSDASVDTVFAYLDQLAPILSTPSSEEAIFEWFEENPEAQKRWGIWYDLCQRLWDSFIGEKILISEWVGGALLPETNLEPVWQRPLVFDLGTEMLHVEADLIKHLSRICDVHVLCPSPTWKDDYRFLLRPYEFLRAQTKEAETVGTSAKPSSQTQFHRFSSYLAEVKFATAQIRKWLEQGVKAEQIAVIAPNLELYWPVLSQYFKEEGIPCEKDRSSRLHSLMPISRWMARLQMECGMISTEALETSLYQEDLDSPLRFEKFSALFSLVFEASDLKRDKNLQKLFNMKVRADDEMDRDAFIGWMLRYWPDAGDFQIFKQVTESIFKDANASMKFKVKDWIELVKAIVYRIEVGFELGQASGIQAVNLLSAQYLASPYRIFLSLSEEELRRPQTRTQIVSDDISSLSRNLDFHLHHPDHSSQEFELNWLAESGAKEDHFCFGWTDFAGQVLSPCQFWLRGHLVETGGRLDAHFHAVPPTRWDEVQEADFFAFAQSERARSEDEVKIMSRGFLQDWGKLVQDPFVTEGNIRLSPSSLETYLDCPFKFAASRVFGLLDEPTLDLDLDKRTKGQIGHLLFERILSRDDFTSWTTAEIEALLDQEHQEGRIPLSDDRIWPKLKKRYMTLAFKFIDFEKKWRHRFPETKTIGREAEFKVKFKDSKWLSGDSAEGIEFIGRIDRIDENKQGQRVVIDYKSSDFSAVPFQQWLKKRSLQLALYTEVVEQGLVKGIEAGDVTAALYYNFKNFTRDVGFKLTEEEGSLYDLEGNGRRAHYVNREKKEKQMTEIKELLAQAIENLQQGIFKPEPLDEKECARCLWNHLCRSPHLNS